MGANPTSTCVTFFIFKKLFKLKYNEGWKVRWSVWRKRILIKREEDETYNYFLIDINATRASAGRKRKRNTQAQDAAQPWWSTLCLYVKLSYSFLLILLARSKKLTCLHFLPLLWYHFFIGIKYFQTTFSILLYFCPLCSPSNFFS